MADMLGFRWIDIAGPDYGEAMPLWQGRFALGSPIDDSKQSVPRNHSIRLLAQDAKTTNVAIEGESGIKFHQPLLLSASAGATRVGSFKTWPYAKLCGVGVTPVEWRSALGVPAYSRYCEMRVTPRTEWPPDRIFRKARNENGEPLSYVDLGAPPLRSTRGRMSVGYSSVAQKELLWRAAEHNKKEKNKENKIDVGFDGDRLTVKFAIDWGLAPSHAGIFGAMRIAKAQTVELFGAGSKKAPAEVVILDLTPEGVELDLLVPNPFAAPAIEFLSLRLRLVAIPVAGENCCDLRLQLVGGEHADLEKLATGLAWISRDLAADNGAIVLQIAETGIPPLFWPLALDGGGLRCGRPGLVPQVEIRREGAVVKLLSQMDLAGGEPGVAELVGHRVGLAQRAPNGPLRLTITSGPEEEKPVIPAGPDIVLRWDGRSDGRAPRSIEISGFDGTADSEALAGTLGEHWGRSGALEPGSRPPFAFLALEHGWVQVPTPDPRPDMVPASPASASMAFRGFMRFDIPTQNSDAAAGCAAWPGVAVLASLRTRFEISWATSMSADRVIVGTLGGASGALDGVLWAGQGSPSPVEILPPRDAGPAALISVPIQFGMQNAWGWKVAVGAIKGAKLGSLGFTLPVVPTPASGPARPLLIWQAHDSLALVSSVAMTRTAESALRPSATRDLVPAEVPAGPKAGLQLVYGDGQRLPRVAASGTTLAGESWRWPWPEPTVTVQSFSASPPEKAGIALASLTLPGVEFTAGPGSMTAFSDMRVSLRYDLPLLDELFASTKAPEPTGGGAKDETPPEPKDRPPAGAAPGDKPATALDPKRLSDAWAGNARRLARARTKADRVVLKELETTPGTGAGMTRRATLWHPVADSVAEPSVRGIVEPYVWRPETFQFMSSAGVKPQVLDLGAYRLGDAIPDQGWTHGPDALGDLCAQFMLKDGTLIKVKDGDLSGAAGPIQVEGFAAASFSPAEDPGVLQDSRGLALAREPATGGSLTGRPITIHGEADQDLLLATLSAPATVIVNEQPMCFWFRDLPVEAEAETLRFEAGGGLETGSGPDPAALEPGRMPKALYEWRFYQPGVAPARFEIPLGGPLAARPLRLAALEMNRDGALQSLQIIAALRPASPPGADAASPFAADDESATGSLVRLDFSLDGQEFKLKEIHRVAYSPGPEPFKISENEPVVLFCTATVTEGKEDQEAATADVCVHLRLAVTDTRVGLKTALLSARLFGQDCLLAATTVSLDERTLSLDFSGSSASGVLQVTALKFIWPSPEAAAAKPRLMITGGCLALPLNIGGGVMALVRSWKGAGDLTWLGVSGLKPTREFIDHAAGVIRLQIDQPLSANGRLFRGFLLPQGRVRGVVAISFAPSMTASAWPGPELGTAFAELAFDADDTKAAAEAQRVTAIRQRYVFSALADGPSSRLLVDAAFPEGNLSSVAWPVGGVSVTGGPVFDADPALLAEWTRNLSVTGAGLVLEHRVRPRLCAHELPAQLLLSQDKTPTVEGEVGDAPTGEIVLRQPWRFRAVVDHELRPAGDGIWPSGEAKPFKWTSIDEVVLADMRQLLEEAQQAQKKPNDETEYAFLPRYRDPDKTGVMRVAGVARRAFADAGFPTDDLLQAVNDAQKNAPNWGLLLAGAAITDIVFEPDNGGAEMGDGEFGVSLVPHWLTAWAAEDAAKLKLGDSIKPLDSIPQNGTCIYPIAAYDAAAGAPRRLDGARPVALGCQDGTQSLVEGQLASVADGRPARTIMPADQAFLGPGDKVVEVLKRPLFPRTLLALKTLTDWIAAHGVPPEADRISCVVGRRETSKQEIRLRVNAWPAGTEADEVPAAAVTLIVLDEERLRVELLPAGLAASLVRGGSLNAEGPQRADAAMRALGLSRMPRVVVLARADPDYMTIRDGAARSGAAPDPGPALLPERPATGEVALAPPHVEWRFAEVAGPLMPFVRGELRRRADTLFASPALGWPLNHRSDELARAQAHLGKEGVRRNAGEAWAGRVRSIAWPAVAWGSDHAMVEAAFVSIGQRVAFRRRAAENFRSAADRLSVLTPARARAPTSEALEAAFENSRAHETVGMRGALAPMLPGGLEVTVTGQRPGVFLTQHEGLTLTSSDKGFDPEFDRFGRPASRGPVVARQVRAPRSAEFPEVVDLRRRRGTFVGANEREVGDDGTPRLKRFKLLAGPASVIRIYPEGDAGPDAVTLTVDYPSLGLIGPDWNGSIRLAANMPGQEPVRLVLARLGILPPAPPLALPVQVDQSLLRAVIQVGETTAEFEYLSWDANPDMHGRQNRALLTLAFGPNRNSGAIQAIMAALRDGSVDTPVRLTVNCAEGASDAPESGTVRLGSGPQPGELIPGPPRVLRFDLPHIPQQRRWLPTRRLTLAFADPAYDRELGSPTKNSQTSIDNQPYVLAVDRPEYDAGATIHLAFWKVANNPDPAPAAKPADRTEQLRVQVVPAGGGPPRFLGVAGIASSPVLRVSEGRAYAIPIPMLRELTADQSLGDQAARLRPGDRLLISLSIEDGARKRGGPTVDVGIVAEAVLPPPASSYGLAVLPGGEAVATGLFATAPLPQEIEFPSLLEDLMQGHVRRRALFLWPFMPWSEPAAGAPFAFLVKVDRTGGGQLARSRLDFRPVE